MKPIEKCSRDMIYGFVGYAAGLVALNLLYTKGSPYRFWLLLLPTVPLVYTVLAIVRQVNSVDEMWRKIATESMAFSGVATGFTCFSYLFIRDMGGPEFHAEWAFYIMWLYYGLGTCLLTRRYQ